MSQIGTWDHTGQQREHQKQGLTCLWLLERFCLHSLSPVLLLNTRGGNSVLPSQDLTAVLLLLYFPVLPFLRHWTLNYTF